jgi:hypothetical protein
MAALTQKQRARFFAKVQKKEDGGCNLWTGYRNADGYGKVTVNRVQHSAHRLIFEAEIGPIPNGMVVRHKCDNPSCVNPEHLEIGTHADNASDRAKRGRSATSIGSAAVIEIRQSTEAGIVMSRKFGVSPAAISLIRANKRRIHTGE